MNYQECIDWLYNQLPVYQRTGGANYKIDLAKTHALMALLGHPENSFSSIHVAGTNGKGSTSNMLAAVYQTAGYTVGLYTSPHLVDFRERIRLNGQMIPEDEVVYFVNKYFNDFKSLQLSFFEMTVGLAFWYFQKTKPDIAIIEVGMGGRLDSTNVVTPLVSVITNIGLDHQAFLGDTVEIIAAEKGGIIKSGTPVVSAVTQNEAEAVLRKIADEKEAPFFKVSSPEKVYPSDLQGNYQVQNQALVQKVIALNSRYPVKEKDIQEGLKNVQSLTQFRGRWEEVSHDPRIILDTGHNHDGVSAIVEQLLGLNKKLHIVWGMVSDKDVTEILSLLPNHANFYFTQPNIPRKMNVEDLMVHATSVGLKGEPFENVFEAIVAAKKSANKEDVIFIGGSTFVVADALQNEENLFRKI